MESAMSNTQRPISAYVSLAVILGLLAFNASGGEQPSVPPLKLTGKMVCIGASITAGEGVKPSECYVGLLQAKVKAEKLDLQVIGQGRSGWSTGAYVRNAAKVVNAMPADATIVTILLGTNDAREEGTPVEVGKRAAENLGNLIDMYAGKAPHAQFVVISPTKAFPKKLTGRLLAAHYGEKTPTNLREICKDFKAVAQERKLAFIDLSDVPSSPANSIDGIHPNAAGHREIFDAIWSGLVAAESKP